MSEPRLLFKVFVPGKVRRQDNGSQGSWRAKAGYRKAWRTRVKIHLMQHRHLKIDPTAPKTVRLIANVFNLYDDSGLAAALKPCEDGVVDGGIIHSDGPRSRTGHVILRAQRIDRGLEGVTIDVREGVDL
jgi:hypothetical protein